MTYRSEGVPFGSAAAYRPGRPRSGERPEMVTNFEIDFLSVGESHSGVAIALRYERYRSTFVHVVNGG